MATLQRTMIEEGLRALAPGGRLIYATCSSEPEENEDVVAALARDQVALLARAADVVAPGGRLVYATCSSEPEENEQVVDRFLEQHAGFEVIDLRGESPILEPLLDDRGMMRTLPSAHGLEAFFAAALIRR